MSLMPQNGAVERADSVYKPEAPLGNVLQRRAGFVAAVLAIGVVWLVVLPWIGSQSEVAEHIATQKRLRIDPSALFYSELEIIPEIAHRVERLNQTYESAFWKTSGSRGAEPSPNGGKSAGL